MAKNTPRPWSPTFTWHAKTLGVLAVLVLLTFAGLKLLVNKLPPPFAPKVPAPQTTPWLTGEGHP